MPASTTEKGLSYGWSTAETGWGSAMNGNLRRLSDFAVAAWSVDRVASTGLDAYVRGGPVWDGSAWEIALDSTVTLTASATNYVERTLAGVVSANVVGFTAGQIPIAVVTTSGSALTAVVDWRTLAALDASGALLADALRASDATRFAELTAVSSEARLGLRNATQEWRLALASGGNLVLTDATDATAVFTVTLGTQETEFTGTLKAKHLAPGAVGTHVAGSIYRTSDDGVILGGLTGSSYQFVLATNGGTHVLRLTTADKLKAVAEFEFDKPARATPVSLGNLGATPSIDLSQGNVFLGTVNANCTITLTNPTANTFYTFRLRYTGTFTPTWPASVKWPGNSTPTFTRTNGRTDWITLFYNGAEYEGFPSGFNIVTTV